ncbi:MAG: hypothetical protein PHY26_02100 [Bacilli bacterium]|nr:hypothetical protein [Bacilli bacterium]
MLKKQSVINKILIYLVFTLSGLGIIYQIGHCIQMRQTETVNFKQNKDVEEVKTIMLEAQDIFDQIEIATYNGRLNKEDAEFIYNVVKSGLNNLNDVSFLTYTGSKKISNRDKYDMLVEINNQVALSKIIESFEIIAIKDKDTKDLVDLITSYQYFCLIGSKSIKLTLHDDFNYNTDNYFIFGYDRKTNIEFKTVTFHARNQAILFKYLAKWLYRYMGGDI